MQTLPALPSPAFCSYFCCCAQDNEIRGIADRTALEATRQAMEELQREREERHRESKDLAAKVRDGRLERGSESECQYLAAKVSHGQTGERPWA